MFPNDFLPEFKFCKKTKRPDPKRDLAKYSTKNKMLSSTTFLRWYYPDQVQRVGNLTVSSQPDDRAPLVDTTHIKLSLY
jgi:hypothetical protein